MIADRSASIDRMEGAVRKVLTVVVALVAVLVSASAAVAQAQTVSVIEVSCESVAVEGSGWEQTEATVEVAVRSFEGGERPDDFVAGPVQVFPDAQGTVPSTTLMFTSPPADGEYVAVVLVDNIARGQSAGFTLTGCAKETLPDTGSVTIPMLAVGLVMVVVGFGLVRRTRTN